MSRKGRKRSTAARRAKPKPRQKTVPQLSFKSSKHVTPSSKTQHDKSLHKHFLDYYYPKGGYTGPKDWSPNYSNSAPVSRPSLTQISGGPSVHSSQAVTSEGGMYPFQCRSLMQDNDCTEGTQPVMLWPLGIGPDIDYVDAPHAFNSRFDACCVEDNELSTVLPTVKDANVQTLYANAVVDARSLSVEVGRAVETCVAMWDKASEGKLRMLPDEEYTHVERRLAHMLHMADIVQTDLARILSTPTYKEAVINGSAAAIEGAMPKLPGLKRHAGALDYMRAEFYFQVSMYLEAFGIAVHNKSPFDRTYDYEWYGFIPRGLTTATNEAWRAIRRQTVISTLLIAITALVAMRGLQEGDLTAMLYQSNTQAMLLTLGLEFLLEALILNKSSVRGVQTNVDEVLKAAGKAGSMLAEYDKQGMTMLFSAGSLIVSMLTGPVSGMITKILGIAADTHGSSMDYNISSMLSMFQSIVGFGALFYPEAAKWGNVVLLLHNLLWVGLASTALESALDTVYTSLSSSMVTFFKRFMNSEETRESFADMMTNVFLGKDIGGHRYDGMVDITAADITTFLSGHGLTILMVFVGALAMLDWMNGDMDETELVANAETWSARQADSFFARGRTFLPEVNATVYQKYCDGTCEQRLSDLRTAREALLRRCDHPDETFRKKGYRVCDDY